MNRNEWIAKCHHWKQKWPVMQPEYNNDTNGLNIYAVLDAVNRYSTANDILMGDAGSISYAGPVALNAKKGQRFIFSPAQADMGWALPAAIGVALAAPDHNVISIIGDGSFMSNIQELAVARYYNLNIKFIVLNNGGYLSIKNTQTKYFDGRVYGTDDKTGLKFPSFHAVAKTFELDSYRIATTEDLNSIFDSSIHSVGPKIIECVCTREQEILPAQALKNGKQAGLHDMTPFLSDEELNSEMVTKL